MVDDQTDTGDQGSPGMSLNFDQIMALIQQTSAVKQPQPKAPQPIPQNTVNNQPIPQRPPMQAAPVNMDQRTGLSSLSGGLQSQSTGNNWGPGQGGAPAQGGGMGPMGALPGGQSGGENPAIAYMNKIIRANPKIDAATLWQALKGAKETGMLGTQGGMDPKFMQDMYNQNEQNKRQDQRLADSDKRQATNLADADKRQATNLADADKRQADREDAAGAREDARGVSADARQATALAAKEKVAKEKLGDPKAGARQVVALYKDIERDTPGTPSGGLSNQISNAANWLGTPGPQTIARGTLQTDISNLLLAMIRTMRGTGRIMKTEIDQIQAGMPQDTDSTEVKLSKAKQGRKIYEDAMRANNFDPNTGTEAEGDTAASGGAPAGKTLNFDAQGNLIK